MTKRFCDLCEAELVPLDDRPFVRQLPRSLTTDAGKVVVSLAVTNERLHVLTDICNKCKLKVINEGEAFAVSSPVATSQFQAEAPPIPQVFHTVQFEPSATTNPKENQHG